MDFGTRLLFSFIVWYDEGMTNRGDNVNTEFRKVPSLKGHQTTYHVYVEDTRIGRVGKTISDGTWQAYTTKGKKVGEPHKTRSAAGDALAMAPFTESGLSVVTVEAPDTADVARDDSTDAKVAETVHVSDTVGEAEGPAPTDPRAAAPVYDAPDDPDEDEEDEEEVEDEISNQIYADLSPSDSTKVTGHFAAIPVDEFPTTHETDVPTTPETDVPLTPVSSPSPAARPSLWARTKAWFRDA